MRYLTLAAIAMAVLASIAAAQCGPNGCSPTYAPMTQPVYVQPSYAWRPVPGNPDQLALYAGGRQLGNWSVSGGYYRPIVGNAWGAVSEPPIAPPLEAAAKSPSIEQAPPTGVEWDKIAAGEKHQVNGQRVSKEAAYQALEQKGGLADDSGKQRVTVIAGDAALRKAVVDSFDSGPLAAWKAKVVVRAYEPTHWHVQASGFKTDGRPTIYVQSPAGKVLHRQDEFVGGAEALAGVLTKAAAVTDGMQPVGALRRPDSAYDPKKDPDLRSAPGPDAPALPGQVTVPLWALIAIPFAVLAMLYFRKV